MGQEFGTRSEVAAYLRVPDATLSRWAYEGRGPAFYRVGKHTRYRWADVERWLSEQRKPEAQRGRRVAVAP